MRTLFLPRGSVNDYRYKCTGDSPQIDANTLNLLLKSRRIEIRRFFDSGSFYDNNVTINFIDRYADPGYIYHPLRLGKILKVWIDSDYVYIRVKLGDYLYHSMPDIFLNNYRTRMLEAGAAREQADRGDRRDGSYVVRYDNYVAFIDGIVRDNKAWNLIVNMLDKTNSFITDIEQQSFFSRIRLVEKRGNEIIPKIRSGISLFRLKNGNLYKIIISYRYPAHISDRSASVSITTSSADNIRLLSSESIKANGYSDYMEIPLVNSKYNDDSLGKLTFSFEGKDGIKLYSANNSNIMFEVRQSLLYWVGLLILIVLFGLSGAVVATPINALPLASGIANESIIGISASIWIKATAAIIQAGVLITLLKIIGKKAL